MTQADIDFFQGIANQILRYLSVSEIKNENDLKRADKERALFKVFTKTADAVGHVVSQRNKTQNLKVWTVKEVENMPYLKDLKYRVTYNGLHQFRYRRDGLNVSFTSKNFETAKEKARKFLMDLKKKMGASEIKVKHLNSLDYVAKFWFDNKSAHVSEETLKSYKSVYLNHVAPIFGSRKISNILPMDLQPFFNSLHNSMGKTCENAKIILNGIFDFAVANRLCPSNPMAGVIIERHYRKTGSALTDEQIKRFIDVMRQSGELGTAYLIILYSGIRGAELEKMTFDWEGGTFTVHNAKLKKGQKANPANLTRTVPIFPGLWPLRDRIERNDWRIPRRILSNSLCRFWTETTVKDLRHTFTSRAREAGVENELVNLWTGHLPGANVTANVYTHFSLDYQKREAEKINNY